MKKNFTLIILLFCTASLLKAQGNRTTDYPSLAKSYSEYLATYRSHDEGPDESPFKRFKRWEDRWRNRTTRSGGLIDTRPFVLSQLSKPKNRQIPQASTTWNTIGPWHAPHGIGRIISVAFHPTDTNTIYAGAPAGGFWKTTDGGKHWRTTTDHLGSIGVSRIVVHPTHPDTIYIATGDDGLWDTPTIGVFRSTDAGESWQATDLSFSSAERKLTSSLIIDPVVPTTLFALVSGNLYKTTNAGNSWDTIRSLASDLYSMVMHPKNHSILFMTSHKGKLWRSLNGGSSWDELTSHIPYPDTATMENLHVRLSPAHDGYICMFSSGSPAGNVNASIYTSLDTGRTFTKMADTSAASAVNWFGYVLAVSPTNIDEIYAGGSHLFRSTDRGKTFTIVHQAGANINDGTFLHVDQHALIYRANGDLFVGGDGGLVITKKGEVYWRDISGDMVISETYGFGASEHDTNFFVMGCQDIGGGVVRGGAYDIKFGGDGMTSVIDPTDTNTFYLSTQVGYVHKTTDGGKTFGSFINPSITNEGGAWTTPFVLDRRDPHNTIYAGYVNVWKTNDGGAHWVKLGNIDNTITIKRVYVAPSDTNVIYVMKEWGYGMYRTSDNGQNWVKISYPAEISLDNMTIDPENSNRVWGTSNSFYAGLKVFFSNDGGNTWTNISGSLPNTMVNSIVYHEGSPQRIFVGSENGVFYRDSTMADWKQFGDALPNCDVRTLQIQYTNNLLYAATYGRGVWRAGLDEFNVSSNVQNGSVTHYISPAPNPTDGLTRIYLENTTPNNCELVITDISGRVVRRELITIANTIDIDMSSLPSGVYVVSIRKDSDLLYQGKIVKR